MENPIVLGSISTGTTLTEDLIPTFVDEILYHDPENKIALEIQEKLEDENYFESEEADDDLNESLFNELNKLAEDIPYCYFGSHPGDGCDYGFWIDADGIQDELRYGELQNADEVQEDFLAVQINDHGNMTLFKCHVVMEEVWGVV
jgi:hypothetical protein